MKNTLVITTGRQFGSGGKDIGEKLASNMGIPFYDKELLGRAAKESGICQELFELFDEKPRSLLYSLAMDPYTFGFNATITETPEQKVATAIADTIIKIAEEGSCVIVGRCADYILKDRINCLSVFICAPMEFRVAQVSKRLNIEPSKAEKMIIHTDKKRAAYYDFNTMKNWGDVDSYNLCIDSSRFGIEETVNIIQNIAGRP